MTFWSPENLATLAHGRWCGETSPAPDVGITGVGIDTRTLAVGSIYVAVRGENHDGHDYVQPALKAGAAFAVVDDAERFTDAEASPVLLVPDAAKAMQAWATAYRDVLAQGGCQVIAVAGSNGKTTTRHLIHHVLTSCGKTGTQSPKSFNNHLGVPLTLLAAQPDHDFVACEVGTNHPGEIAALAEIVRPDVAVITNIGEEHLEAFKTVQGVAQEECSIFRFLKEGGRALVEACTVDPLFQFGVNDVVPKHGRLTFGSGRGEIDFALAERHPWMTDIEGTQDLTILHDGRRFTGKLPMPGHHNACNAAGTVAVAHCFGIKPGRAVEQLASIAPMEMRSHVMRFGKKGRTLTLIHDAYNANPSSMQAALFNLMWSDAERKVAVLGDMLELGPEAESRHENLAWDLEWHLQEGASLDGVVLVGALMQGFEQIALEGLNLPADAVHWFPDADEAHAHQIASCLRPGDTVLLKGSRGMRLERILPAIEKRFGPPQT